jgi:hypothetical protein
LPAQLATISLQFEKEYGREVHVKSGTPQKNVNLLRAAQIDADAGASATVTVKMIIRRD